jgi:hypothetical protein
VLALKIIIEFEFDKGGIRKRISSKKEFKEGVVRRRRSLKKERVIIIIKRGEG